MHRYQLALSLALGLFLVGCGEKQPDPANFPTTPDAPGTGEVDSRRPPEVKPASETESPENLVVPDVKAPKPEEKAPTKDADGTPAEDAEGALNESDLEDIKKLPADLQALAIQQVRCPMSGEHLGSMGKPVVQTVDGKTVFLCCGSCVKEFKEDPKAALAKLSEKK